MCKRLAFLVLALGFCLSPAAHATNVILVNQNYDTNVDGTQDDLGLEDFLKGLGYQVDVRRGNWTTLDATKIAELNAADLIVVSRSTNSGDYNSNATEVSQWSGITTPMINLTAYLARNSRWFWVNSGATTNLVGPMMEVVAPEHPIFTGIQLNAANQVAAVDGTTGTGQTSLIASVDAGNGTLLARSGANGWIMEWQPGQPFYASAGQTPAGKRLLFCAGTQESGATPQGAFNLTEDGKKMLSNAILYMTGKSIVEGQATDPQPEVGQTDVPFDVVLSWTAGEVATAHDVYVGLSAADVNSASRTAPLGVLAGQGQSDSRFAATDLQFGQTYSWRVDEVDASGAIVKGEIWSFTVEPLSYPIASVTATASSAQASMGPENTINGSGLNAADQHSTEAMQMWMSKGTLPNWVQYEFDNVYKLTEMWVWNSNQMIESFVGFGAKDVTIEYSADGVTWTALAAVPAFAQAPAAATYTHNTTVDFGGVLAQYVKLTINASWSGLPQTGLAEVRFFQMPVQAREPQPASGATGVDLDATLNWRPGREAASHQVYFGADPNSVANGTAPAVTVTEHSYSPASLQFGTTYYWKVDEVGAAATQAGDVWSFTSQEFAAIDDFESYNDDDSRIYDAWLDGLVNGNGSTVGYFLAPFAEKTIIHGGKQSMPFEYNNVKTPFYSEAEREFSPVQNWTGNGADSLSLWVRGNPVRFLDKGNGAFTVSGSGTDIWNAADNFRFVYKRLTGDGSIVVKVDSLVNTNVWAKAGVMIRQSLEAGSPMAYMIQSAASGASFGWRLLAAGACGSMTQAGIVAPQWVKLTRKGNVFTAQYSADGTTWTDIKNADGTVTSTALTMTGSLYIGLCVTSHDVAKTTTAEFSAAAATGGVTGDWQVAEIGVDPQPANSPDTLYVVVQDSAGKTATATHPTAVTSAAWTQVKIPLSGFTGVSMSKVKKLTIGVGNRTNPKAGGAGMIYIDDIGFGHPAP